MTYNIGDRVKINHTYDGNPVLFPKTIGAVGTVTEKVPGSPECLWFTPDEPVVGVGCDESGQWAVLDSELDKLED
jgi:hypothetical protein